MALVWECFMSVFWLRMSRQNEHAGVKTDQSETVGEPEVSSPHCDEQHAVKVCPSRGDWWEPEKRWLPTEVGSEDPEYLLRKLTWQPKPDDQSWDAENL